MGQNFKEVAHLRTDMKKYGEEHDRIFGKKKKVEESNQMNDDILYEHQLQPASKPEDISSVEIKDKARQSWQSLDMSTGCEGFPESSSYVYGYIDGYEQAIKDLKGKV